MSAVSPGRLLDDLAEVLAEAVVDHAALDGHAESCGTCWKTYVLFGFV